MYTVCQEKEIKKKITFKKQLFEGIHFMKNRPKLFWFLLATYMPFIGVMMANYLIPVYISDILKANASVYAIEGMMYGVGYICCRNLYSTHNEICQNRSFNRYDDVHLCNFNYRNDY